MTGESTLELTLTALPGMPEVEPGAALTDLLLAAVRRSGKALEPGDVRVVAQKIISKAEGRRVRLAEVAACGGAGRSGPRRLNRWLLERTLGVIRGWSGALDRCVVVSRCRRARALAAQAGARVALEPGGEGGLNRSAALGAAEAAARGAGRVLLLPCDLPLITSESLTALASAPARRPRPGTIW